MSLICKKYILILLLLSQGYFRAQAQQESFKVHFEFYNDAFNLDIDGSILVDTPIILSEAYIKDCYEQVDNGRYQQIIDTLLVFKKSHELNDWLYYQLVRKTAQQISPKAENYPRYTFYKWFLMVKSGYDARLTINDGKIVFFVRNEENISDIPFIRVEGKKYMCLNYHDYESSGFHRLSAANMISTAGSVKPFSYKVTRMPEFEPKNYKEKQLTFNYRQKSYHFDLKVSPEVGLIFKNYPGVDFEYYFNIPLTKETYGSLIPMLKENVKRLSQKRGVDYLMRFTRYAFLYENDNDSFGKEKRLSPEETLFSSSSDCDDRAALFFYLVKEIYNLPMITLLYPTHMTMAVQFEKPSGKPITYNGKQYTICEPTPQNQNLKIGKIAAKFKRMPYEVVYAYDPK